MSRESLEGGAGNFTVGCDGFGSSGAFASATCAFAAFALFFFRALRFAALVIGFFSVTTGASGCPSAIAGAAPSASAAGASPPVNAASVRGSRPILGGSTITTSASLTASRHASSAREMAMDTRRPTPSGSFDLLRSNVSAAAPTISTHLTLPSSSPSSPIVAAMESPMGPAPAYSSETAAPRKTNERIRSSAASKAREFACAKDPGVKHTSAAPCRAHTNRSPLRCVQCGPVILFPGASFQLIHTECTRPPFGGSMSPGPSALLLFQSLSASAMARGAVIGPAAVVGAGEFHTNAT